MCIWSKTIPIHSVWLREAKRLNTYGIFCHVKDTWHFLNNEYKKILDHLYFRKETFGFRRFWEKKAVQLKWTPLYFLISKRKFRIRFSEEQDNILPSCLHLRALWKVYSTPWEIHVIFKDSIFFTCIILSLWLTFITLYLCWLYIMLNTWHILIPNHSLHNVHCTFTSL